MTDRQRDPGGHGASEPTTAALGALAVLALLAAGCQPEPPSEMDLETLLARHTEARGGAAAIEAVETLAVDLEIVEPGFTVTGEWVGSRDGWMRIDVYAGDQRVFTEALGPDGGWQMHADGVPLDLSAEGEVALRRGISFNLYGLHELAGRGFEHRLVGAAELGGERLWEVLQVAPDGFSRRLYLDAERFLITREVETRALHPDVDPTETRQETVHSEHAANGGIVFSNYMVTTDQETGEVIQTTTVTARRVNEPVAAEHFRRPPAQPSQ